MDILRFAEGERRTNFHAEDGSGHRVNSLHDEPKHCNERACATIRLHAAGLSGVWFESKQRVLRVEAARDSSRSSLYFDSKQDCSTMQP